MKPGDLESKIHSMNIKPAIGFLNRDGEAPFTNKVTIILESLNGNSVYPNPTPALAVVEAAFEAYKLAAAEAAQGGRKNIAERDARRAELVAVLRQLSSYVEGTANGDMVKLLSSGFPVQKPTRTPVGPLPAPAAPVVTQGPVTGTIAVSTAVVRGASSYNWSLVLKSAPGVEVQTAQTTSASTEFSGLVPGQIYLVSVNAVGASGTSDWSDDGSLMVI